MTFFYRLKELTMLNHITQILSKADTKETHVPPTLLYNEGWMLRLVLNFFATHDMPNHPLSFHGRNNWHSEALLPTQFYARDRSDKLAESWTHADGVYGDFMIGDSAKGDLKLLHDPKVFVVTEAKMFSKLTPHVTNANYYNQAARNVACIAEVLNRANIEPKSFQKLGFYVLVPKEKYDKEPSFNMFVSRDHIKEIVLKRVTEYSSQEKVSWYCEKFLPVIEKMDIDVIHWEDIICEILKIDILYGKELQGFYEKCIVYNRIAISFHRPTP